jgi:aminoglycoside phosphotransferase (APT) family kinase protein
LTVPAEVLAAYGLAPTAIERAPTGLIHHTFFLDRRFVAQGMHVAFGETVLEDLDAVTRRLEAAGMVTPRLVATRDGALGARDAGGRLWRVLTYLEGHTVDEVPAPVVAAEAAGLAARFHRVLLDDPVDIKHVRAGAHDTRAHLARLEGAGAGSLGDAILDEARHIEWPGELPRRLAHGDLKISNVLFRGARAVALLDLDTVGWMPLCHELGDAWRSWANPRGESTEEPAFDLGIFAAAVMGYAAEARDWVTGDEAASLVGGIHGITVELASRFALDVVEDRYFGWDAARFPSRREHNRVRATAMLILARQVRAVRAEAERIVAAAFASRP